MLHDHSIHALRSGPTLADLFTQEDILYWSFCATGQAFCPEPFEPPLELSNTNLVEPLGGSLLHLLLRPPLKIIDADADTPPATRNYQLEMLSKLLEITDQNSAEWIEALKARDLFGFRAVDYTRSINVLRGRPLEQSVSTEPESPKNFRGIIRSLTKDEMINSDLFYGLKKARSVAGLDLFPGIATACPRELRQLLLRYHDIINIFFSTANTK